MKILLDHCVPQPLKNLLTSHGVSHAYALGWQELRHGDLLEKAEQSFQVLITSDKNIAHQRMWSGKNWLFWFFGRTTGPNFEFNPFGS